MAISRVRPAPNDTAWVNDAVNKLKADARRSSDTHLIKVDWPALEARGIDFYLKDESSHPTGSLKHRLARSLFIYGLVNQKVKPGTLLVEASSGSTAVSEAYFARRLGLQFVAVMAKTVSRQKIEAIEFYGGRCHLVEKTSMIYDEAQRIADENNGYFFNQFVNAEKATDWRSNNNIAESIFQQMEKERYPEPTWVVVSAGTGGTCATLGRYLRYTERSSQLCVADPENSVFYDAWLSGDASITCTTSSMVEGIGRPRVEASFLPQLVDSMVKVPDPASFAACRFLSEKLGRKVGGSTGTNFYACMEVAADMVRKGQKGSIVSLICDGGERYVNTYYNNDWLAANGYNIAPYMEVIQETWDTLNMPGYV